MRALAAVPVGLTLAAIMACLRPPLADGEASDSHAASDGAATTTTMSTTGGVVTTTPTSGSAGGSASEATEAVPEAVCGNGVVEGDEGCDDGNADPQDACSDECTATGLWAATYDHPGPSAFWAGVAFAADGRVVVAGYERGEDYFSSDTVLAAYEPDGALAWLQSFPGLPGTSNTFDAVAIAPDGTIVTCGSEYVAADELAFRLRAFTLAGASLWTFTDSGGPEHPAYCGDLALADGAIFTTGTEFDSSMNTNQATVRRHEPGDGTVSWKQTHPGASTKAYGWSLAVGGGRVVVTGEDWFEDLPGPRALLLAYDLDGALSWEQASDEDDSRWVGAAAIGASDFVIAGTIADEGFPGTRQRLRRIDGAGGELWTTLTEAHAALRIAVAPDLSIVAAAASYADVVEQAVVLRLSPEGDLLWSVTDDGPSDAGAQGFDVAIGAGLAAVAGSVRHVDMNQEDAWVRVLALE